MVREPASFEMFGVFFSLFFFGFVSLIIFVVVAIVIRSQKIKDWKQEYSFALDRYRSNPSDPGLRQAALEAGRQYSNLTRNGYGIANFDENAIQNDLYTIAATALVANEPLKPSIESRLQTLESLLNRELISETEYQSRRSAILDEI